MRVVLIGHYRDGGGYSTACREMALAMDSVGLDVILRPLKLNDNQEKLHPRLLELENKSAQGAEVVINHTLPSFMDYDGRVKNIAYFASETSSFRDSGWADKLNVMDEVWVINRTSAGACRQSGVQRSLRVIPHAVDTAKFEHSWKPLPVIEELCRENDFIFYTIGEFNRRKNYGALLAAFHAEFDPEEPVQLVVKAHKPGMSTEEFRQGWNHLNHISLQGIGLYRDPATYKKPILLPERMSEEEINRLHSSCDCFVQPSHGEAWSIPAMDAMGFGKTPIVTNWGGYLDYISGQEGFLVDCKLDTCFGADSLPGLYTANELWASVNLSNLRRCMRLVYEDSQLRSQKAEAGLKRVYDFSYNAVGNIIKAALASMESSCVKEPERLGQIGGVGREG